MFVDTSVLYAALDADDDAHARSAAVLRDAFANDLVVTSNYVVVETSALVQRRLGAAAVADLHAHLVPALEIAFVDRELHAAGIVEMRSGRRSVSFVDGVSFELMRRWGIAIALTLDRHFARAGFTVVPA